MDIANSIFNKIDFDSSGGISQREWEDTWEKMLQANQKTNGVLSRKEWTLLGGENAIFDAIANKQGQPAVLTKADWQRAFARLDKDRNGQITAVEWATIATGAFKALGGYRPDDQAMGEDRLLIKDQLQDANNTIQRQEKAIQERQASSQRTEQYYISRINDLREQVQSSQQQEEVVRSRLYEKEEQLRQLHEEEIAIRQRVEMMELQLKQAKQQREKEAELQASLDHAQDGAARLDQKFDQFGATLQRKAEAQGGARNLEMLGNRSRTQTFADSPSVQQIFAVANANQQDQALQIARALGPHGSPVKGKLLALYFASSSMTRASEVTALLSDAYRKGLNDKLNILYVSYRDNQASAEALGRDMPWPMLSWEMQQESDTLAQICNIAEQEDSTTPALVVLNENFNIMTHLGVAKVRKDPTGQNFPQSLAPQLFADLNNDLDAIRWVNQELAVVALWSADKQIALSTRSAAKAALADAGGDLLAMPFRFFNAQDGGPQAETIRKVTKTAGDTILLTDFGNSCFYVCNTRVTSVDDVKRFVQNVYEQKVPRTELG